jgi:hypothetical protein
MMKKNLLCYALSVCSLFLASVNALEELSRTDLSISWWGDDLPETFQFEWKIANHLLLAWPNITTTMTSVETKTFTRENYGPAFDGIVKLITDGVDLRSSHWLCASGLGSCVSSPMALESDMFQMQTGCYNDIDLEGNRIESISLEADYDVEYKIERSTSNRTVPTFHFTIAVSGQKLLPNEGALALIDLGRWGGMCGDNTTATLEFHVFEDTLRWAVVEFPILWDQVQLGDKIQASRVYGTRSVMELLTNGDDGQCSQCIDWNSGHGPTSCGGPVPRNESTFFQGLETCFNGVDLQGNYLQSIFYLC